MDGQTDLEDVDALTKKLDDLKLEHRDLDEVIDHLTDTQPFDELKLKRLKKRKLLLKDQISQVENMLVPDIIA